jgi:hypothetical protein
MRHIKDAGFSLIVLLILLLNSCGPSLHQKQQALAQHLGVRVEDYAYPESFPLKYFQSTLRQGATINDVHSVIQGYDKVVQCQFGGLAEVYYYFGTDDKKAMRIQVSYDEGARLRGIGGEDNNSRSIQVKDCVPGRIGDASH